MAQCSWGRPGGSFSKVYIEGLLQQCWQLDTTIGVDHHWLQYLTTILHRGDQKLSRYVPCEAQCKSRMCICCHTFTSYHLSSGRTLAVEQPPQHPMSSWPSRQVHDICALWRLTTSTRGKFRCTTIPPRMVLEAQLKAWTSHVATLYKPQKSCHDVYHLSW